MVVRTKSVATSPPRADVPSDGGTRLLRRVEVECETALQPIVDIHSGQLIACEALVRGTQAIGYPSVDSLLDHASEAGCLLDLEGILIGKAMTAFAKLRQSQWAMLFLNVGAGLGSRHRDLVAILDRAVSGRGLAPSDVCIEISERNEDFDPCAIENSVTALKAAGYSVAIDDFGTGAGGLMLLHKCSPNFLKIDRFFIASIQSDRRKKVMVSSIVNLSHAMGIRVIAEGVESVSDLHQCRDVRCDLAQGWLIERPTSRIAELAPVYSVLPSNPDRRRALRSDRPLRSRMISLATLEQSASLFDAIDTFRKHPEQNVIPVINAGGIPTGIVRERDVKPYVYSRFGPERVIRQTETIPISDILKTLPITDAETPLGPLLDIIGTEQVDGIFVTEGARYVGYLPASAVAAIANELRMESAADRNPLSRLPGNGTVKSFIDDAAPRGDVTRLVCYVDLDNFKPFNDTYGFRAGDRALLLLADALKSLQVSSQVFVGHIGGDDFFLGAIDRGARALLPHLERAQHAFASSAESLYSQEDRQVGGIMGKGRDGAVEIFELLTCTIAVLELPVGFTSTGEQAANLLAEVKAEAKLRKGSITARCALDLTADVSVTGAAA